VLEDTLENIARHAFEIAATSNPSPLFSAVWSLDGPGDALRLESAFPQEYHDKLLDGAGRIDLSGGPIGVVGRAAIGRSTEFVADVEGDRDFINVEPKTRSVLAVPVMGRERMIGVIDIEHDLRRGFPERVKENIEIFAAQAATAIENALVYEKLNQLHSASMEISASRGLANVAQCVLEDLRKIIPFSRATLQRIQDDERTILSTYGEPAPSSSYLLRPVDQDDLVREILEQDQVVILSPPNRHPSWTPDSLTAVIRSWIGIPLNYGKRSIGFIAVDQLTDEEYLESHKQLLGIFARHAASSLQNALLLEEKQSLIDDLSDQSNLALIGLVFGESIHYARAKLGMAKVIAADISLGVYSSDLALLRNMAIRIKDNISDYLDVLRQMQASTIETPRIVAADVHGLLDRVLVSKRKRLRDVALDKKYFAAPSSVQAPERLLKQVFFVVIENALKAMNDKGALLLETDIREREQRKYLVVAVSDTGRGIPESQRETLFRQKPERRGRSGSGIGLPWAYSFLSAYGGTIEYDSTVGKGTTVRIFIPTDFRESLKSMMLTGKGAENG